jgi:hypothetical protein
LFCLVMWVLHPILHYKIGERFGPGWISTCLDTMQDEWYTCLHPFCKYLRQQQRQEILKKYLSKNLRFHRNFSYSITNYHR